MAAPKLGDGARRADPATWTTVSCGERSTPWITDMPVTPSRPIRPTSTRSPLGPTAVTEAMPSSGKYT